MRYELDAFFLEPYRAVYMQHRLPFRLFLHFVRQIEMSDTVNYAGDGER